MLSAQFLRHVQRFQWPPQGDFGAKFQLHPVIRQASGKQFIKPAPGIGNNGLALLMEKRWHQPKPLMLRLESTFSLGNPALPKNDNLLPASQRIHHNRPFFESNPHEQKLDAKTASGNPTTLLTAKKKP
jgi:hypothetical protein